MNTRQIADQIKMAGSITELDQHAKAIWLQFGEGHIEEQDAEDLDNEIRIKRTSISAQVSKITSRPVASIEEQNAINAALSRLKKGFSRRVSADQFCTRNISEQISKKDVTYQWDSSNEPADFRLNSYKYNTKPSLSSSISIVSKTVKPQAKPSEQTQASRRLKRNKQNGSAGLEWAEITKLGAAAHYIQSMHDAGILCMATISNKLISEREIRDAVRKFKSCLLKYQNDVNTRPNWLQVWESKESIHAHILFRIKGWRGFDLVARLAQSNSFPGNLLNVKRYSSGSDFLIYCGKEHTTWVGRMLRERNIEHHRRVPSSFISGQRVRICPGIEADLIASGKLKPTKKIYASRTIPSMLQKPLEARQEPQIYFLPLQADLFGGTLKAVERPLISIPNNKVTSKHRAKIIREDELPLALPPDARDLIKLVGSSDRERAEKLGVSRAQVTNIKNGQFGSSRTIVKKLLELTKLAA